MFARGPPKQLQSSNRAGPNTRCQRCLKLGHHTYECSNPRPYVPRPSRSKQLASGSFARDAPSIETPEEFKVASHRNDRVGLADKILAAKEAERQRLREEEERKARKRGGKGKKREDPVSDSDSESESDSSISRSASPPARRRKRYSSESSSDDDSASSSSSRSPSRSPSPPPRRRASPRLDGRDSRSPVRQGRSRSPIRRSGNGNEVRERSRSRSREEVRRRY